MSCNGSKVVRIYTPIIFLLLILHYIQLVKVCSFNSSLFCLFLITGFLSLSLLSVYHKTPRTPSVPARTPRLTPRHSDVMIYVNIYRNTNSLSLWQNDRQLSAILNITKILVLEKVLVWIYICATVKTCF